MRKTKSKAATSDSSTEQATPAAGNTEATSQTAGNDQSSLQDPRARNPDNPFNLASSIIALPLLNKMKDKDLKPGELIPIIIDVNLFYQAPTPNPDNTPVLSSQERARAQVLELLSQILPASPRGIYAAKGEPHGVDRLKTDISNQYVFANLTSADILRLVELDRTPRDSDAQTAEDAKVVAPQSGAPGGHSIYRIWLDHEVHPLLNRSLRTVKADAAQIAFGCSGSGIVWAVVDSGIDGEHPHFYRHKNLDVPAPLGHQDFTVTGGDTVGALIDTFGHGTHVAGIIGGELRIGYEVPMPVPDGNRDPAMVQQQVKEIVAYYRHLDDNGTPIFERAPGIERMCGMAPECKLLSLKALNDDGKGNVSNIMTALAYIQKMNGYGRKIQIHGVNLSVGYPYDPEWFACGQSPLCVEADRLVKSGVAVVVAAGNTGYGSAQSLEGVTKAGFSLTINDPGNSDLAITVGSTHREMPHVYGVSYFSSKGPTGDGRDKPDLVAPGEKILSCAAKSKRDLLAAKVNRPDDPLPLYREESGTSMAAPHVSGVIAAFLSTRREYIGQPEKVKQIFMEAATDLRRQRHFQGRGLVDLMRSIQSV